MTVRRQIVITGMHDSGVDEVSEFLREVCIREDQQTSAEQSQTEIHKVNLAILESLNCYWDQLDIDKLAQLQEYQAPAASLQEMQMLIGRHPETDQTPILTDPLFCLTLQKWLPFLTDPILIVCLRNPLDTAKSLKRSRGFSIYKGLSLWESYLWSLKRAVSLDDCIFVFYEQACNEQEKYGERILSELVARGVKVHQFAGRSKAKFLMTDCDVKAESSEDQLVKKLSHDQIGLWQRLKSYSTDYHPDSRSITKKTTGFVQSVGQVAKNIRSPKSAAVFLKQFRLLNQRSSFFVPQYYLRENPDIKESGLVPSLHFINRGWQENRNPNPFFDLQYYKQRYPDIEKSSINPYFHYLQNGWKEGRKISADKTIYEIYAETQRELPENGHPIDLLWQEGSRVKSPPAMNAKVVFKKRDYQLTQPVTVLVPVYLANEEAARVFQLLLKSILSSYPAAHDLLSFLFIDDCSPVQSTSDILEQTEFDKRADCTLIHNDENIGFVRTVNRGFGLIDVDSDVVILNSDTEIHGQVFERLQNVCHRYPKIGSVTPLSNRATIACLVNWPFGADTINELPPKEIAEIVGNAALDTPHIPVPSGHGFCMYMSAQALEGVGVFDEESFSQGYGEENDWSVRAIRQGFKHLITTECYVHHHESKSFGSSQKEELKKKNSQILSEKYPFYDYWVQNYLNRDPLEYHRKVLRLFLLGKVKQAKKLKTICYVLHDSFKNPFGGVQQHLRHLIDELEHVQPMEVLVVAPTELNGEFYELHYYQGIEKLVIERIDDRSLLQILHKLEGRIDYLHMHNTFGVIPSLIEWVKHLKVEKKLYTIHDYQLFCKNPFLLNDKEQFCLGNEEKEKSCLNDCHSVAKKGNDFLSHFDHIIVPSENTGRNVKTLLKDEGTKEKISVLPHFLPFFYETDISTQVDVVKDSAESKNIVFLGALYRHKGGELFLSIIEKMQEMNCTPMILGHLQKELVEQFQDVPPVHSFHNWKSLCELKARIGVDLVVMPSICAETFSYTLYETLFLLNVPVVVGEFGHPAEVIKSHRVGEIATGNTAEGLLAAIKRIIADYDSYQEKVTGFRQSFFQQYSPAKYLEAYTSFLSDQVVLSDKSQEECARLYQSFELSKDARNIQAYASMIKQTAPLKVLMVHGLSENNPPYFYRFANPAHFLKSSGCFVQETSLEKIEEDAGEFDIIYLSRTPLTSSLKKLLKQAEKNRITTILDVDDLIFHEDFLKDFYFLADDENHLQEYKELLVKMQRTFEQVDYLLGSTPQIAALGEEHQKTSLYFRNLLLYNHLPLFKTLYEERPRFKKKIIGYFSGSNTHDHDFASIVPVLEKVLAKDNEAELLVMGFIGHNDFMEKYKTRITIKSFSDYEDYLRTIQLCKVVVTPLARINMFSDSKSNIKFLEAAAVGTPVIATPIDEMNTYIEHGVTGWLADSDKEWEKALQSSLCEDYGEYVGARACRFVMKNFKEKPKDFHKLLQAMHEKRYGS